MQFGLSRFRSSRPQALACIYACCVPLWFVLLRTPAGRWWPINLASVFDLWLYAPLPLLALLAFPRRDWRAVAWLALPLLLLAGEYGPGFLPKGGYSPGRPLRVLTANLNFMNANAESVANVLQGEQPDVIAVQELGEGIVGPLAELMRGQYPYQSLYPSTIPTGIGVFSRYRINSVAAPEMAPGACSCQQVEIDLNGRSVTILIVHPSPPRMRIRPLLGLPVPATFDASRHERSLRAILDRADTVRGPLLIVGDFNLSDRQPAYRAFSERFGDVQREAGWGLGYTFPNQDLYHLPLPPFLRIDYVFHDGAWASSTVRTRDLPGSDHRFVVADLVLLDR
jgi:vancomycin resistance protein VanJ